MTVSKRVCTVSKSITISSIGSIESISLGLSISITLSIAIAGITKTIPMTIAKRRVSKMTISMTKRINTVSKTISSIRMVESISISFSLTLGNMDNTSRVGNISASTSIVTMHSRDSSRGNTMDTYSVGNIGNTIHGGQGQHGQHGGQGQHDGQHSQHVLHHSQDDAQQCHTEHQHQQWQELQYKPAEQSLSCCLVDDPLGIPM